MRTIVSSIETAPYGSSKHLMEIIQLTLHKNKHRVINSYTFVQEAKTWKIHQDKKQVSYDVVNLYPSVPFDKAVNVLTNILNILKKHLKECTKININRHT